jgi:hypothetical protein
MFNPTKRRTIFFGTVATVASLFGLAVIYRIGFGAMSAVADVQPERLRDFTFSIWHQYSWTKHGFLSFLAADSYAKGEAYANEPLLYLWLMRALYQIQLVFPKLTMRTSGAALSMSASLAAIGYVIPRATWQTLNLRQAVLMLLAFGYFLTLPTFWIAVGKFNVDNGFVLIFPVLLVTSHLVARYGPYGARFWTAAALMCLLMPVAVALFAVLLALHALFRQRADVRMLRSAVVMAVAAVAVYLQPVVVMKLLGFSSLDSTWLFRSGLDGDMRFYGNFVDSVLAPQFNRPAYFILVPAALLILQLWYRRKFGTDPGSTAVSGSPDPLMPYLFSVYVLTLLFWPQAVSIHPYLYDAILVGPLAAWAVLNFAMPGIYQRHFFFWLFVLLFLVMFNLTKIAQAAHCTGCYFPGWDMLGARAG